jgi:hypothetical protein
MRYLFRAHIVREIYLTGGAQCSCNKILNVIHKLDLKIETSV